MPKQNYTIFLILFSLLLLTSCKSKEDKVTVSKIQKSIDISDIDAEKALLILDSLGNPNNLDEKSYMLYQIAHVKAKRKANLELSANEADRVGYAAQYFEKRKDAKNAALANFYAGVAYEKSNDLEKGFSYYLKTYPFALSAKDTLLMGKAHFNVAILYLNQEVYDSTIVHLEKALPLVKSNVELEVMTYKHLAFAYFLLNNYDSALKNLKAGTPLLEQINDDIYTLYYNNLYGVLYSFTKKHKEASKFYHINLNKYENRNPKEYLRTVANLTDFYVSSYKDKDSATYYKNILIPLLSTFEIKNKDDNYLIFTIYKILRDYYIQEGDKEKIIEYATLYSEKNKELDSINASIDYLTIDKDLTIKKLEFANKQYNMKLLMYAILFCVIIFSTTLLVVHRRLKNNEEREINQKIQEIDKLRKELKNLK